MQRTENSVRRYIKITILLMMDYGMSISEIADTVCIDEATIQSYGELYNRTKSIGDYLHAK